MDSPGGRPNEVSGCFYFWFLSELSAQPSLIKVDPKTLTDSSQPPPWEGVNHPLFG